MKKHLNMLLFVIIMGFFTSGLLAGTEALTRSRREANQTFQLQSAILDAFGVDTSTGEISDIFNEEVREVVASELVFYIHKTSDSISIIFSGLGVWDEIIGVLTLEDDFVTIRAVHILEQAETPGLGGVIAEPTYLKGFVGKSMEPILIISRTADTSQDNEVDAIVGGTRTSNAFEDIINDAYQTHKAIYETLDLEGDAS